MSDKQLKMDPSLNVLGDELKPCSTSPVTGFFRDGCCNTGGADTGKHTVCCIMTKEFLAFSVFTNVPVAIQPEKSPPQFQSVLHAGCLQMISVHKWSSSLWRFHNG